MLYQKPKMEILKIEVADVICASVGGIYEDGNESQVGGSWVPQPPTN